MAFDEAKVRSLAKLAHLALSDSEIRATASDLERLLGYIEQLQGIDVSGAAEAAHVGSDATPLRADLARPGLPREILMAGAPAASAGLFEVPRVVVRGEAKAAAPDAGEVAP